MWNLLAITDAGLNIDLFYVVLRMVQIAIETFMLISLLWMYKVVQRICLALTLDVRLTRSADVVQTDDKAKGKNAK